MARTKAEVRAFLNSKVGKTCVDKSDARLNGQCVCLIKNLMEFLGVGSPYVGRGNAKDAGDTYIRQEIGTAGRGWLTICVNRGMGGGYGHIWVDLLNEDNYESNGAIALVTTKNTRPITQAQQFVNFDQWIQGGNDMVEDNQRHFDLYAQTWANATGRKLTRNEFRISFVGRDKAEVQTVIHTSAETAAYARLAANGKKLPSVQGELTKSKAETAQVKAQLSEKDKQIAAQSKEISELLAQVALQSEDTTNLNALGQALQWFVARVGLK